MITKEKFEQMKFISFGFVEPECEKNAYRLPAEHVLTNHNTAALRSAISNLIHDIKDERHVTITELITLDCDMSFDTYKKAMCGKGRTITRPFLSRLCVGLKISIEKANELFRMQGGELNLTNDVDAITYYAIIDQDSVTDYEDELMEKTGINL